MTVLRFGPVIAPTQGDGPPVYGFTATPAQVESIARVHRAGRDGNGVLSGFQRPQIAAHIREIEDFLRLPDAMLPNAIVLAFSESVRLVDGHLEVDTADGPPGWVVDGQQRLSAALRLDDDRPFEFVVTAFLCEDRAELNRQFILVNNTRPLPKALVYELLPGVAGLPRRLSDRAQAALLVEALNYREDSSLRGQILQQTNPMGTIRDTVMHRLLMNSIANGALRAHGGEALMSSGYDLVEAFFGAVQDVFGPAWEGHNAKTSRLVHGVGVSAMGYIMDELAHEGALTREAFAQGLTALAPHTHWTSGEWEFGTERRPWNSLQNTKADYWLLAHHLVRLLRRRRRGAAA